MNRRQHTEGATGKAGREEREWEFTLMLVAFVVLACLWEAVAVWYRP